MWLLIPGQNTTDDHELSANMPKSRGDMPLAMIFGPYCFRVDDAQALEQKSALWGDITAVIKRSLD